MIQRKPQGRVFNSLSAVFFGILSGFLTLSASAQDSHVHDYGLIEKADLEQMRLIDIGKGQPKWMKFRDALKYGEKAHKEGRCGGFMDLTDAPALVEGVVPLVEWFKLDLRNRTLRQGAYLNRTLGMLDAQRLFRTVEQLSSYRNRYFKSEHGVKSAQWIAQQFQAVGKNRRDVKVELFQHAQWDQPSVVATLEGSGPRKNEVVVIGGHLDSINQMAMGSREMSAPGADDNASGISTVLEVFRVLVETGFVPDRTIQFMGYAAEEVGLRGSQEIANTYKNTGKNVVAVAQFDMTSFPGSGDQIVFMTDFVNPELTKYAQMLVDTYVKVKWSTDKCGYACSDHASWTKAGYPSIMPFEAGMRSMNSQIHTTRDLISSLDFKHGLHFAKLGLSFVTELSKE